MKFSYWREDETRNLSEARDLRREFIIFALNCRAYCRLLLMPNYSSLMCCTVNGSKGIKIWGCGSERWLFTGTNGESGKSTE